MSYSDKDSSEVVECLVDVNNIHDTNLSNLSSTELEEFAELSQNMSEMETQDLDDLTPDDQVEEVVQSEFGAEEIEIETITAEELMTESKSKSSMPPLHPLTIAPKPVKNVPIAIKPVTTQQLLLVQGIGGQQVKLLSTQGQEVNLSNIQIAKPLTIKPALKANQRHTLPILQPKQVVMKKVLTPVPKVALPKTENKTGQIVVVQKSDAQQVTLLQSQASTSATKTITLAQAQQMGFKLIPQVTAPKSTIMLNKAPKTVKIVPQIKSPTKILPAPQTTDSNKVAQRIFIKPANSSPIIASSQLIQVTGGQAQALQSGQLHQIQIPGKGVQYIKFVTTTSQTDTSASTHLTNTLANNVTGKIVPLTTLTTVKGSNILINTDGKKPIKAAIAPKTIKTAPTLRPATVGNTSTTPQLLMVPASYLTQQQQASTPKILPIQSTLTKISSVPNETAAPEPNIEPNGMRPRKPCNCTKSQCLKLYCDCFANGEFCYMCNCMNCFNNLENEEHRNRAIKNCLERNPNAFRPKIGKSKDTGDSTIRKHTKGCNCKRSGCLKNYCECYEAKIACSSNCKCIGCRNVEDALEKKNVKPQLNATLTGLKSPTYVQPTITNSESSQQFRPKKSNNKQTFGFLSNNIVEATCQCLLSLAQSEEIALKNDKVYTEKMVLEEFGKCLQDIVACSLKF